VQLRGSRASAADVHQCLYLLRKKIERSSERPRWIKNVNGFGYWLDLSGSVSSVDSDGSGRGER
jgi:DNA-binding winged helix-turn-helix (wHTH) protein